MNELENKYKDNSLTPAELTELRKQVNGMTEKQLEERLRESWNADIFKSDHVVSERLKIIKEQIDSDIQPSKHSYRLPGHIFRIAAAILLPLLLLTSIHFYRETVKLSNGEILFSTQEGERANITLPDGTQVTLNTNTFMTYSPGEFNYKERNIQFNGEAYFDVATNPSIPFIIHTKDLRIKVLGTKFNLHAYSGNNTMSLTLEEGHVLLSSRKEEKELFPNQKAILDCHNGRISIIKEEVPENASAWRNGELAFSNQELQQVLSDLEQNYGVRICIESHDSINTDLFTGKIPADNLLDALEVLKYSYHMKYRIYNKTIYFSAD